MKKKKRKKAVDILYNVAYTAFSSLVLGASPHPVEGESIFINGSQPEDEDWCNSFFYWHLGWVFFFMLVFISIELKFVKVVQIMVIIKNI